MLHFPLTKFADEILEWKVTCFTIIYLTFYILKHDFYQHNKDEDLLRNNDLLLRAFLHDSEKNLLVESFQSVSFNL